VIEVQTNKVSSLIQRSDIILEIDGFPIDVQATTRIPITATCCWKIFPPNKRAGETVSIKLMRDRKEIKVDYVLPKARIQRRACPIVCARPGTGVSHHGWSSFQPLTVPYLQSWVPTEPQSAVPSAYATREQASRGYTFLRRPFGCAA
jgi:hypothetical protein